MLRGSMHTQGPTTNALHLMALLVSPDTATIEDIRQATNQMAISVEECRAVLNFAETLRHKKFEAVIVDFRIGEEQTRNCIRLVRRSPSNQTAVVFAITDSNSEAALAFMAGTNCILQRPLTGNSIMGVL